jgi:hypothetical protein
MWFYAREARGPGIVTFCGEELDATKGGVYGAKFLD